MARKAPGQNRMMAAHDSKLPEPQGEVSDVFPLFAVATKGKLWNYASKSVEPKFWMGKKNFSDMDKMRKALKMPKPHIERGLRWPVKSAGSPGGTLIAGAGVAGYGMGVGTAQAMQEEKAAKSTIAGLQPKISEAKAKNAALRARKEK